MHTDEIHTNMQRKEGTCGAKTKREREEKTMKRFILFSLQAVDETGHEEVAGPLHDLVLELSDLGLEAAHGRDKVGNKGLALVLGTDVGLDSGSVDLLRELKRGVEELTDLHKVIGRGVAGGHRGSADAHTAGVKRGYVARDSVLVKGNLQVVAELLVLAA